MFTISSFSSDTTAQSRLSKSFSSSLLRRIGVIKLLILIVVIPIMILTIVNPMWICIFMKYPHVHSNINNIATTKIPTSNNNVHTDNLSSVKPKTQTNAKSYKGGIKVTQETLDVIVASKDGRRIGELETTITMIESIPPSSNKNHKQTSQHDTNKKETANAKAYIQLNDKSSATKNNDESIIDKVRERLFKNRNNCAYVALSVITLCAVTICGIVCLSSDNRKTYESVNDDEEEESQLIGDHYIRVEDCDDEKLNENNVSEIKTDAHVIDYIRVQVIDNNDISSPTSSPPPYSSSELGSTNPTTTPENIKQSTDEN